jgi:hypothetical protein
MVGKRSRNLMTCNAVASDTVIIWWDRLDDNPHRLRQSIGSDVKIGFRKSFSIFSIVFLAPLYSQLTIPPLSPHVTHHSIHISCHRTSYEDRNRRRSISSCFAYPACSSSSGSRCEQRQDPKVSFMRIVCFRLPLDSLLIVLFLKDWRWTAKTWTGWKSS